MLWKLQMYIILVGNYVLMLINEYTSVDYSCKMVISLAIEVNHGPVFNKIQLADRWLLGQILTKLFGGHVQTNVSNLLL